MKNIFLLIMLLFFTTLIIAKNRNGSILGFIENKGQIIDQNNKINPSVKFLGVCNGFKVQLKANSFSYEVLKVISNRETQKSRITRGKQDKFLIDSPVINSHRIDVELINANPSPQIITEGKSNDYLNYYTTGTPENGITEVYSFSKMMYKNIYPHIDLEFVVDDGLKQPYKYNFIVHPGGNVNDIQLHFVGANRTELMNGCIQIDCNSGSFNESIPMSYEIESGRDVTVNYKRLGKDTYGFQSSMYNNQSSLIIDPWATYYGGIEVEEDNGISCDDFGNVYCSGTTHSMTNIATQGAYQTVLSDWDAYMVKFNNAGSRIWGTYYGGQSGEHGLSIACDSHNNILISGETGSNTSIATTGAYQTNFAGAGDMFIAKFNSSGMRIWSTYYGGSSGDGAYGVGVDKQDKVLVVGYTGSTNNIASPGAHQTVFGGYEDAVVVKLDSNGNRLWATYYGGTNPNANYWVERAYSVATDINNNIVVIGYTNSSNNISTIGAHQENLSTGPYDGFVVKFNSAGIRQWGTYYGGSLQDDLKGVAVDASSNIIFGGGTHSIDNIATPGSFKPSINSRGDFIVKMNPLGVRIWATYYKGTANDWIGKTIAVGDSNTIVFTGATKSPDSIATPGSFKDTLTTSLGSVNVDAYIVKFDSNGNRLWGTYYGGEGDEDISNGVAIDINGNLLIAGTTNSSTGIATIGAFQTVYAGNTDAFIASFNSFGQLTTAVPSLNNAVKNGLLQVYPNPTKDKVVVHLKSYTGKEGSLKLQTIEGKLIKQCSVKAEETSIDLKELAIGVYLLEYSDGEVCETVKVVKE